VTGGLWVCVLETYRCWVVWFGLVYLIKDGERSGKLHGLSDGIASELLS
jgi:hypothetical protein